MHIIYLLVLFTGLSSFSFAQLEQKLLPINPANKQITLTLFHFNESETNFSIHKISNSIATTAQSVSALAAASLSEKSGISVTSGKITISPQGTYLIKNSKPVTSLQKPLFSKRTFLLFNNEGLFALGYAPATQQEELTYAIKAYLKTNQTGYKQCVLLDSSNSCGFYKENIGYHPYYLREIYPAKSILTVK